MKRQRTNYTAISLFTGAGGMDVGVSNAGFKNIWANDIDKKACETYSLNHKTPIHCGDLTSLRESLRELPPVDLIHGGPPCQGFSVAGKMDPNDSRSQLLWDYADIVKELQPRAFICENVAALGRLEKWKPIRVKFLEMMREAGYTTSFIVLNACDYGVPQKRERVFFLGFKGIQFQPDLEALFKGQKKTAPLLSEVFASLGRPGNELNTGICNAKITMAKNPIMRKSPYAGMLFNGAGRPLNPNDHSSTMHASMGGNKTPFIDEKHFYENAPSWVEEYHEKLQQGGEPLGLDEAPSRLRRITVSEAREIQSFPRNYIFSGQTSSQFKQIGNAVPCGLAEAVATVVKEVINSSGGVSSEFKLK